MLLIYDIDESIIKRVTRDRVQFPMQDNSSDNNILQSSKKVKALYLNNMPNPKTNTVTTIPYEIIKGSKTLFSDRKTYMPSIRYIKTENSGKILLLKQFPIEEICK